MVMSVSVSEQSFQYVGILNGVMYRIDPSSGQSLTPMFEAEPFKQWPKFGRDEALAPATPAVPAISITEPAVETPAADQVVKAEQAAAVSNLFPRSGAEPLRAGHPDLWALLVAGTCLEGSSFSSP
jgi:hypothetical protein